MLILDEVDSYPGDVGGEGDPVEPAVARAESYGSQRKILAISTSTVKGFRRRAGTLPLRDLRGGVAEREKLPMIEAGRWQATANSATRGYPGRVFSTRAPRAGLRHILVMAEVAIAIAILRLSGGGLMPRSFQHLRLRE